VKSGIRASAEPLSRMPQAAKIKTDSGRPSVIDPKAHPHGPGLCDRVLFDARAVRMSLCSPATASQRRDSGRDVPASCLAAALPNHP
jgi:hypothetical protein